MEANAVDTDDILRPNNRVSEPPSALEDVVIINQSSRNFMLYYAV